MVDYINMTDFVPTMRPIQKNSSNENSEEN